LNIHSKLTQTVSLNNFGNNALAISNIKIANAAQNAFAITHPIHWHYTVPAHSDDSVVVTFSPVAGNTEYDGTLALTVNDGTGDSLINIPLVGKTVVLTGVKNPDAVPQEMQLEQNYPNPFADATQIRFALPQGRSYTSNVTLTITDALGRKVADLSSAAFTDLKNVIFHAGSLPDGIYFCKLSDGASTKVITMLHMK